MANEYSDHNDLIMALENKSVPADSYKINAEGNNVWGDNQYILRKINNKWYVYYEEREIKKRICILENFVDAGDFLFWKLTKQEGFIEYSN